MSRRSGTGSSSASAAIRKIASLGLHPINDRAARGVHGSTLPAPYAPLPSGGIDCSRWSRAKLEQFFRERYTWLGFDSVGRLADVAMQDGRIEGRSVLRQDALKTKPSIMSRKEFRERHGLGNADSKRKYREYLKLLKINPAAKNRPASNGRV